MPIAGVPSLAPASMIGVPRDVRQFVFWVFLLVIAAAMGGSIAYAARPWVDAAKVLSQVTDQQLPTAARPTFTPLPTTTLAPSMPTPTPTATLPPIKSPTGRTNYLLLGSDNDAKNLPNTAPNTQSIIFVSYDSVHHQAYMISIPRDLYVPIPGFGYDKIDTAPGYDNLGLVVRTVEANFHVNIDHYAWVGLKGFINIIDSLGGVDIAVSHPIVESDFPDDLNPNTDPHGTLRFFIPAGPQHLDGITALEYVRARHADRIGDFGRSQRQQQVLLQLKQKLKGVDLGLAPSIVQALKGEFKTDLTIPEMLGLGRTMLGLKSTDIHQFRMTDTGGYVTDRTLKDGNQVLMPSWDRVNALFQCVMSDKAYLGCQQ